MKDGECWMIEEMYNAHDAHDKKQSRWGPYGVVQYRSEAVLMCREWNREFGGRGPLRYRVRRYRRV